MITHALANRLCGPKIDDKPFVRRPWQAVSNEAAILETLERPPLHGETLAVAYQRLEHQLAALLSALSIYEARELHRRLSHPTADDPIAARFARMIGERRQRLLTFLADAPRRAALQQGRK